MKKLKFRMWNPSSNSYLHDVENVFECLMQQIVHDKTMPTRGIKVPYNHREDGLIWEQFTGLKDKKGIEIYLGDIVQFYDVDEDLIGEVVYDEWYNVVLLAKSEKTKERPELYYHIENAMKGRVIGNIHENPELL